MSYRKSELIDLLRAIYKDTHQDVDWDPNKPQKVLGGGGTRIRIEGDKGTFEGAVPETEGPTLVILQSGILAFNEFIAEVMKNDEFKKYITPKAVEKKLESLLRKTQGILPDGIEDELKTCVLKPLREEIRPWYVFVPVDNLLVMNKLKIGDVLFLPKQAAQEEIDELFREHKFAGEMDEQKEQRKVTSSIFSSYCESSAAHAKVSVRAHVSRASQKATEIAYVSINALRAFTHVLYSHNLKTYFGLPNEVQGGTWLSVCYGNDERQGFNVDFHRRQALIPFELNETKINQLNEYCCFRKIQQILATQPIKRGETEKVAIQALQALGSSVVAPTIDMKFLNCTIALERILIANGEETTTERFTDRLALLIHPEREQRLRIKEKAKELYNKRSKIVHAAFFGVEEDDYFLLENWAIVLLIKLLGSCSQHQSHREFCEKIDELKYG